MTREMLSHFNLSTHPFSKEIPTDQLLTLPSITSALTTLELLVETKGIGCLTGKSGTGKSCLIRMLIAGMHTGLVKPLYLCHTSIGVMEFYTHLATALGLLNCSLLSTQLEPKFKVVAVVLSFFFATFFFLCGACGEV